MTGRGEAKGACLAGLLLLLAAHAAGNIWWLWRDNHPVTADEALHMQFAELFYRALFANGDAGWGERLAEAAAIETIYPPLLHLMGAALWLVMPYSGEALAFASTLAFLALLAGVYALTAALFTPRRALLAAVLVGFTPFLYGASRLFIQDVLAAAFVVWTLYAAHRTAGFQRTGWVIALALLAGLGLLARWTTPLYYAFPVLLLLATGAAPALRDALQRGRALRRIGVNAGMLLAVGLALAAPWYWTRLETLRTGYQEIFVGRQGAIDWLSLQDWTFYLILIINTGTFLPLFLLACAGFAVMLRRREERTAGAMLLLWVVAAYLLLTITWSFKSPAPRYVIPFLPAFGIAGAAALAALPRGRWRMGGAAAAMAIFMLQYANLTFAPIWPVHRIEAPVLTHHNAVQSLGHGGLVIIRDRVRASAARYYPAFRGENWVERILDTMHEKDRYRYMAGTPRLQYGVLRVPKVGLERLQTYYAEFHGGESKLPLYTEPEAFDPLSPLPLEEFPDLARGQMENDGLETWFSIPKPVSAYSITYEDEEAAQVRLVPQFWNPAHERWDSFGSFSAPIMREGLTLFQQTTRVLTEGVRMVPARASLEPRVEQVLWYAAIFPYRPLALVAEGETLEEMGEDIQGVEYLVVGGIRPSELAALEGEFIVIDRFDAQLSGYWQPIEITLLARYAVLPG